MRLLGGAIGLFVFFTFVILLPIALILTIGQLYWHYLLPIAILAAAGFIYYKRQKRARDTV